MEASVAAGRMARMGWMGGDRPRLATDPRGARSGGEIGHRGCRTLCRHRSSGMGSTAGRAAAGARASAGRDAGDACRTRRPLRAWHRLPRCPAGSPRGAGGRPAQRRTAGRRRRLRGRSAARRARAGGPRRHGLDRQERQPADARTRRLVGLPRRAAHLGRAAGGRADPHDLRLLHAVHVGLPDRRHRGAADDRRATLHQLSDHRAPRRAEPRGRRTPSATGSSAATSARRSAR